MLDYQDATNVDKKGMPLTVRSVFFLDPKHVIRAQITYPASTGRNFHEILRVVDSLLVCDANKIVPPTVSTEDAKKKFGEVNIIKPYLRTVKLPL
ncbi:hypothetical protein HDU91_003778 [Kappamyces sp. JEL0680]|nr:hypothetical protein HDU91_003778 [Kappamyces sp. JEL0680]